MFTLEVLLLQSSFVSLLAPFLRAEFTGLAACCKICFKVTRGAQFHMFYLSLQQVQFLEVDASFAIVGQSRQQLHLINNLHWWRMISLPPIFGAGLAIWCRFGRWRVETLHLFPEGWDERVFTGNLAQHRHPPSLVFASTASGFDALYIASLSGKVGAIGRKLQVKSLRTGAISTLSFRGCQLGAGCAGLAAVGLRLAKNLTSLNLGGNSLGGSFNQKTHSWQSCDDGIKLLCAALCESTTLRLLDLSSNVIGYTGAALLGSALSQNSTLTSLDLSNNSLWCRGVKSIAEAIWGRVVDKTSINGTTDGTESTRNGRGGTVCRLTALDLRRTKMGKEGALAILSPADAHSSAGQFSPRRPQVARAANAAMAAKATADTKAAKVCIKSAMLAKRNGDLQEQLLQLRKAVELQPGNVKIGAQLEKLVGEGGGDEGSGEGGGSGRSGGGSSSASGGGSNSGSNGGSSVENAGGSSSSSSSSSSSEPSDSEPHQHSLSACRRSSRLTFLNLAENNLAVDISWLPPSILSDANHALTSLNLSQLGDAFPHAPPGFTPPGQCLRLAIEVLRSERLTCVDLSGNKLTNADHADGLAILALGWLVQTNRVLARLILERCELVPPCSSEYYDTSPALHTLERAFEANNSLVHVNLSGNHFGDAGAAVMGRVLAGKRKHTSTADPNGPRVGSLQYLCSLQYLDLCHNQISGTVRKQLHTEFAAQGVKLETSEVEDCITGEGFDSAGDY
jgi:hypothetical protein